MDKFVLPSALLGSMM